MYIPLPFLGNGSVKIPLSLLGKGSAENVTAAKNTHATVEEL
jgi:hypothetical protein